MELYYVGLDIHKRTISYCRKKSDGRIIDEGRIGSSRSCIDALIGRLGEHWIGGMESTMFSGWVYDHFYRRGHKLRVAHPYEMSWISKSKKKNDRIDAAKIADLLRCGLLPEVVMLTPEQREMRKIMRFRTMMLQLAVKMKNCTSTLLMENGIEYDDRRLHGKHYFESLADEIEGEVPDSVSALLGLSRSAVEYFDAGQKRLIRELANHPSLKDRLALLMTIPGVGIITALTWALEVGDPHRFSRTRHAVSYCGLCSAQKESAEKSNRGPLSKQRNSRLQTVLIEAAKLAPRFSPALREVHDRELTKGNRNRATVAVARKLVSYLLYVDKNHKEFEPILNSNSSPVLASQ